MANDVHVNPEKLEEFIRKLNQLNEEVSSSSAKLRHQIMKLSEFWQDAQYQRFAEEFKQEERKLQKFIQKSESYIPELRRKARLAREFQRR